jgi:U32 family peptidase
MILATIKSVATLQQPADGFILGTPWGLRCDVFAMEQIPYFRTLTNKPLLLNMERILHQAELDSFMADLQRYHSYVDGIYFSDMGVLTMARQLGIVKKMIYNPSTLLTNRSDIAAFLEQGLQSVCVAKELTLAEITDIIDVFPDVEVFIHGYMVMFYAKRHVLKHFTTKEGLPQHHQATLTDESRSAQYPILDDEHGSHILQQDPLASFAVYDQLQTARCRVDGYFISEFEHHFVLQCYDELGQGTPVDEVMERVKTTLPERTFTTGFYFKKTTYTQNE